MVYTLLVLIIGGLGSAVMGLTRGGVRRDSIARGLAMASVVGALGTSLVLEGFREGAGRAVVGAEIAGWLGAPIYRSDALAAELGAWVLVIGLLGLLRIGSGAGKQNAPLKIATGVGLVTVLYSLAFTVDLRAFAGEALLLVLLVWAFSSAEKAGWLARQRVALGVGSLLLLGAVLLVGRTTGGEYNLDELSLAALTLWPLVLIVGWALLWLGLAPFTGWSALMGEADGALVHALALGAPPLALVLRLQALITEGALTGSTPAEWATAMGGLATLGGITALAGGAGALTWAGTPRWRSALTAHWLGMVAWALGLDSPAGRWAALTLFAAYGLGGLALELAKRMPGKAEAYGYTWLARTVAGLSLAGAPLTAGFVGLWLLSVGLLETRNPALAIMLLGAAVLSACGTTLHLAQPATQAREVVASARAAPANSRYGLVLELAGWAVAGTIFLGGILPGLWLPYVEAVAGVAGAGQALGLPWPGVVKDGVVLPLTMLGVGVLVLGMISLVVRAWATSRVSEAGALLPTALERLQDRPMGKHKGGSGTRQEGVGLDREGDREPEQVFRPAPPAFAWWLSLAWLEGGIFEAGTRLVRLGSAAGRLMERLEGRYFLPLAVLLALLMLLGITR
jgi:hypothetical protein